MNRLWQYCVLSKQLKYMSTCAAFEAKNNISCEKCSYACQSNVLNEFDKVYPFKSDRNITCKMNNITQHLCQYLTSKTNDYCGCCSTNIYFYHKNLK